MEEFPCGFGVRTSLAPAEAEAAVRRARIETQPSAWTRLAKTSSMCPPSFERFLASSKRLRSS